MNEEASKFGLHVSWSKTKIQNLDCGSTPSPVVAVNGNTVEPVQDFTYLQGQHSNEQQKSQLRIYPTYWTRRQSRPNETPRQYLESNEPHHANENSYILHMRTGSFPLWFRNLDPYTNRLETIGLLSTRCQRRILHTRWYDFVSNSCLLYTSPSPRDRQKSRMPSSA